MGTRAKWNVPKYDKVSQRGVGWQEVYSDSNNHCLKTWWAEKYLGAYHVSNIEADHIRLHFA